MVDLSEGDYLIMVVTGEMSKERIEVRPAEEKRMEMSWLVE